MRIGRAPWCIRVFVLTALVAFSSCSFDKPQSVGGIPKAQDNARASAPLSPEAPVSPDDIREAMKAWKGVASEDDFRNKVIGLALTRKFAAKAREVGLDNNTDYYYRQSLSRFRREKLSELYLRRVLIPSIQVTEEDYARELEKDKYEDIVNLRVVTPRDDSLVEEMSRDAAAGKGFEFLLEKYGSTRSRATRGAIGLIRRSNPFIPPEEKERVYGHKTGVVFGPVALYTGPAFLQIEEKFTAKEVREIAKKNVTPVIQERKRQDAVEKAVRKLKKEYPVTYYKQGEKQEVVGGMRIDVAARVGKTLITTGEAEASGGPHVSPGFMDYDRRLGKIVQQILFAKAGEDEGLDRDEGFAKEYAAFVDEALASLYRHSVFERPVPVTEKELRNYYERNKESTYFRFKEASYLVLQDVPPDKLDAAKEKTGTVADAGMLERTAKELGVKCKLVLRKKLSELPEPLVRVLVDRKAGDVFTQPAAGGNTDIYKMIHIQLEESFPPLDLVRKDVETHIRDEKRTAQLDAFVKDEWGKIKIDDAVVKMLYREYREGGATKAAAPHRGMLAPAQAR